MKKAVFFVGHLRGNAAESSLEDCISKRAKDVGVSVTVFNSKLFPKPESGWCSGRITVNQGAAAAVGDWTFWPRSVYVRPWKFPEDGAQVSGSLAGSQ